MTIMITGEQVKAARNLLGWSQLRLALEANVNTGTLVSIEKGRSRPLRTASKLRHTLEHAGVELLEGEPPRLKSAK
jgi:transcriptional regulator with XRE-family HTH domain